MPVLHSRPYAGRDDTEAYRQHRADARARLPRLGDGGRFVVTQREMRQFPRGPFKQQAYWSLGV